MFNLLSGVVNTVKNIFGGGSKAPAPKPAAPKKPSTPQLKPLTPLPAYNPYIAKWGDSPATIQAGQTRNNQSWAATQQIISSNSSTLNSNQIAAQRIQQEAVRLAAERERIRKEKQAAFDKIQGELRTDKQNRAKIAIDRVTKGKNPSDWRVYLNDDGSSKVKGQKDNSGFAVPDDWVSLDPRIQQAKSEWSAWYNSKDGTFQKTKDEYRKKSEQLIANSEKSNSGGFWNWLTGANKDGARSLAQKNLTELETKQTKRYDDKLNAFLKAQASKKAEIENKKFSSQAEFDQAVKGFSDWETANIDDLEYTRGASAGMAEGYGKKASEENKSPAGTVGSWFNKNIVNGLPGQAVGGVWKYTLGEGDENIPSIVTAPMRAINSIGNTIDQKRQINQYGNKSQEGLQGKNPWQASFNQRNWNIGNAKDYSVETDKETSYKDAVQLYKQRKKADDFSPWYKDKIPTKEQWLKEEMYDTSTGRKVWAGGTTREQATWGGQNGENRKQIAGMTSDTIEFLSDPMLYVGGTGLFNKIGKGASWIADAVKATKTGEKIWSTTDKIAKSKPIQWLNKEYKTPDQEFSDALKIAKSGTSDLNKTMGDRINAINKTLSKEDKIDTSILNDLKGLSDKEAAIVQRMVGGKFGTLRDRMSMMDVRGLQYAGPTREKLLDISRRWNEFAEKMKMSDKVQKTSWGGKNRTYSPFIDYTGDHTAENYNFFAKKSRRPRTQSAEDFARNAETRFLKSGLGNDLRSEAAATRSKWTNRRDQLSADYNKRFDDLTAPVRAADVRRGTLKRFVKQKAAGIKPTTSFGRSLFNTTRNTVGLPTKIWKQSVLKYRPAWTVNNALYNTQAAALAGGTRALGEQARMLRPKNWKQAMSEVPDAVKADLTGEMGKGKLNKFYNGVENWSRVAAFRAAKSKGLSDAEALKRVDKYLFNYKTKNYERPLKTFMPFYAWNKNLTKAAVTMPFDRPAAAMAYHRGDQYQQNQFDAEFEKTVPELQKLGYSADEIKAIKDEQAKYYKGRLKVGNQWITTPFNAFSEKGLTGLGFNPYLSAAGESATSTDSFGRKISGEDASLKSRVASKFPQYELGKKTYKSWRVASGIDKPTKGWIGEKGSEGYGLTKERQGYDDTKPNYDRSMDPRAKLGQDALAFVGVPRGIEFDTDKLVERKKLQKLSDEYFSLDTKNMEFPAAEAARNAVFKKYGITPDEFYKGVLSKYDTDNTKKIKGQKEVAAAANKSLFAEYAAQPAGTRNVWATEKLRQLNEQGYFKENPFLRSFDWISPASVAKADRQSTYLESKRTGDWSKYRTKFGDSRKVSSKKVAYDKAKKSGDWTEYTKVFGTKKTKQPANSKSAVFWRSYAAADKDTRKTLLKDNPEFNNRANWTADMWTAWKSDTKKKQVAKARSWGDFALLQDTNVAQNKQKAKGFLMTRGHKKTKRLTWS
ncbi:hypothetical protein UFOVP667_18 [uncultured Caudovirales phage]|uniref:Uncharacterized protein n=1 Tax=uncultured Caudovirales phage TaxID=2100421 RepID=A0A6J5N996_9CAUD|nr:hypothetical protein UFOVP667_18 [uncultured Caudovirales phage]